MLMDEVVKSARSKYILGERVKLTLYILFIRLVIKLKGTVIGKQVQICPIVEPRKKNTQIIK